MSVLIRVIFTLVTLLGFQSAFAICLQTMTDIDVSKQAICKSANDRSTCSTTTTVGSGDIRTGAPCVQYYTIKCLENWSPMTPNFVATFGAADVTSPKVTNNILTFSLTNKNTSTTGDAAGTINFVCLAPPAPLPPVETTPPTPAPPVIDISAAEAKALQAVANINRNKKIRGDLIQRQATSKQYVSQGYFVMPYTLRCNLKPGAKRRVTKPFSLKVDIAKGTLTDMNTGQGVIASIQRKCR